MTHSQKPSQHDRTDGLSRRRFLAGIGGATGLSLSVQAGRASATTNDDADGLPDASDLEAVVDTMLADRIGTTTPGATVAIVTGDSQLLTKGYGAAAVDTATPVRAPETAFRVGSVGKLITYTAVMQGVERGVLDLDTDVNDYLTDSAVTIPETYDDPVTLRHLGTHTAGFESTLDPVVVSDSSRLESLEAVLADQQPPRIRPSGNRVGYSNYGAALAGHIVAEAHDTTFEDYVQSRILEPLGMTHSTFIQPVPADHPGDLAAPHRRDEGSFTTTDAVYLNMYPAGSLSATATDIAAFMRAHLRYGQVGDAQILEAATLDTMQRRQHVRHPAVTNWRYGFHEYRDADAGLLAHSGATIHYASQLLLAPDADVGIFVAYNSNSNEPPAGVIDEIASEIGLYSEPATPTATTVAGGRKRAATATGEYSRTSLPQSGPLQVVDTLGHVTVEATADDRITTTSLAGDTRQWIETAPYVYRDVDGLDTLAFDVTEGEVEAMYLSSEPTGAYLPVSIHEQQRITAGVLGAALGGFGLSLTGWSARSAWKHLHQLRANSEATTEESA